MPFARELGEAGGRKCACGGRRGIQREKGRRAAVALFQALGLRTVGLYAVTISISAPAFLITYLVAMYISSFPIIMALRQTNAYEERSIGLDSTESGASGICLTTSKATCLRPLVLDRGLIPRLHCETHGPHGEPPRLSRLQHPLRSNSGYGTVGLSAVEPHDAYSLSAAFHKLSKVIMRFLSFVDDIETSL